ncbi:hypothetical protein HUA74_09460 [Myxococcus sp. CA051A]|uniref:hypothetical protein n=1 Tax=unclassified Myxococcus TaxID=2648731 RepID=UPI00157A86D1|nr:MULTISPECIES: hypothetical protein [unclassified Myxococcus]NTX11617.1 hypothetical protein [Myxococcus sp. CA056]NTX60885.1 hypothetical protein [Myxococcus sp. CA051A]
MSRTGRTLFSAALLSALFAACSPDPTEGTPVSNEEVTLDEQTQGLESNGGTLAACTATAICGTCTTLTCSGTSTCSALNGTTGFVTCDGVTKSCRTCTYGGMTFNDGEGYPIDGSTSCSAKDDGYCLGGPFSGRSCVGSGECYARCCNGEWQ